MSPNWNITPQPGSGWRYATHPADPYPVVVVFGKPERLRVAA